MGNCYQDVYRNPDNEGRIYTRALYELHGLHRNKFKKAVSERYNLYCESRNRIEKYYKSKARRLGRAKERYCPDYYLKNVSSVWTTYRSEIEQLDKKFNSYCTYQLMRLGSGHDRRHLRK